MPPLCHGGRVDLDPDPGRGTGAVDQLEISCCDGLKMCLTCRHGVHLVLSFHPSHERRQRLAGNASSIALIRAREACLSTSRGLDTVAAGNVLLPSEFALASQAFFLVEIVGRVVIQRQRHQDAQPEEARARQGRRHHEGRLEGEGGS